MNIAYLSIGSNIGDRLHHLTKAVRALHAHDRIEVTAISSIYETEPVGYTDQANFLNLVLRLETSLNPFELLDVCQGIENDLGRVRDVRWGPRTVDLDILLYNNDNIESENLTVPHPRMDERAFVLVPLLEIAPDSIQPGVAIDDDGVVCWETVDGVERFLSVGE
ncbi:2-amino-4-hydroxy-6-hydroxymethyldihydropteridine diphosphokinase [Sporosarcina highlanderae]|uniref:2-amino-4-hydroxy-6-hydroxymethyldihydropteridine diphosphokinase n=1 Tax=Sporosarcina highlanderae TaxID=3035916 RepID=A0ABT8JUI2_9BACL|nr:2-amino-4-hydroxy-6-hydroxymethyldihydropteridine diphosphokinase [Sporosarcina highlanderae]MDN4608825.1 2-amino-4-hydroxy-6-hydroxymethyldihydropteridine diphosphokinase [Sporosarcina highlanderae]